MAYSFTTDEKYFGFFSSKASAYPDAPASLNYSFVIAANSAAQGLLKPVNFFADTDVYAMGTLSAGTYSVSASNAFWFFGTGYSNFVSPVVSVYNSFGQVVAGGVFSSTSFNVTSAGDYFIGVIGSTFSQSQYSVNYSFTPPLNSSANSGTLAISGSFIAGTQVSLTGTFIDANGLSGANSQGGYVYGWYTSLDNLNWTKVGSGATYTIGLAD
jgi:hypothetical protein